MGGRTAFVLGGGGLLGAVEVGMLRALLERGVRPDMVLGTSVGALNGLMVASDPTPGLRFILDPHAEKGIADAGIEAGQRVTLLIGPEGGLSERDRLVLRAAGYQGLRLGPRILRTETAGLAALAAINALFGDWR